MRFCALPQLLLTSTIALQGTALNHLLFPEDIPNAAAPEAAVSIGRVLLRRSRSSQRSPETSDRGNRSGRSSSASSALRSYTLRKRMARCLTRMALLPKGEDDHELFRRPMSGISGFVGSVHAGSTRIPCGWQRFFMMNFIFPTSFPASTNLFL